VTQAAVLLYFSPQGLLGSRDLTFITETQEGAPTWRRPRHKGGVPYYGCFVQTMADKGNFVNGQQLCTTNARKATELTLAVEGKVCLHLLSYSCMIHMPVEDTTPPAKPAVCIDDGSGACQGPTAKFSLQRLRNVKYKSLDKRTTITL